MPTIECRGIDQRPALADILRLFYGTVSEISDGRLVAGFPQPLILCQTLAVPGGYRVETVLAGTESLAATVSDQPRREARRQLYCLLATTTGLHFPWGSLTGIRPTVMALDALTQGGSDAVAYRILVDHWRLAPATARLALTVTQKEQDLLCKLPIKQPLVYVGIPFCPSRCDYCSFITEDAGRQKNLIDAYVDALIREIRFLAPVLPQPAALYLGGGTPTSLSPGQLEKLFIALADCKLNAGMEFTVEAGRPDTIDATKLSLIREAKAQRLCINPQTFWDSTLTRIGRRHRTAQTLQAFALARREGFAHINLDLIAGLPGELPPDFAVSLRRALDLQPESITVHALSLKRSSALQKKAAASALPPQNRPQADWLLALRDARRQLERADFHPYYLYRQKNVFAGLENVGFARPGHECFYNVGMMSDRRSVLGLGCGAASKRMDGDRTLRLFSPRQAAHYIENIDSILAKKEKFFSQSL